MARTAITPRALAANGSLDSATGPTTIDAALVTAGAIVNSVEPERTVIRVTNTEGSTNTVTIKAGDNPPALAAGQGDLVVTVAATTGARYIGPLESGRFLKMLDDASVAQGGSLYLDFETGMTGTIDVLLLPRAT
jgi:hypothetical protein